MPKTRLNSYMRSKLKNHVPSVVKCPSERAVRAEAKSRLTAVTDALVAARFPEREMAVLQKYDVGTIKDFVDAKVPGSRGCEHLPLSKPTTLPYNSALGSCHYALELPADHEVWALWRAYRAACEAVDVAESEKRKDYYALIDNCRNFEDVLEVWPEAEAMREQLNIPPTHAISTLSEDVIERIKADVAQRAAML